MTTYQNPQSVPAYPNPQYPTYPTNQNPSNGYAGAQQYQANRNSPIIYIHPNEPNRAENAQEPSFMRTDKNERKDFIKKVYALLTIQLAITTIFAGITVAVKPLRDGLILTYPLFWVCIFISIVLLIALFCSRRLSKKYPYNYIALFIFTLLESYIIAFICAYSEPLAVLAAAVMTLSITAGLTIYAWKTKKDFTLMGGLITVLIFSVFWFGIFMIFLYSTFLYLIYAFIVALIFGFYIVYDTQLIAGGRYNELTYDDYVIGALLLYIDIIGLFLIILSLFGNKRS
ncbi:unnamed protein product [Blepharisma stoltei]|uniref:Uncharacterized protein n=1 Tax=Blepharisma stoltei TaxID=1481888 RepID=A0AAU9IQ18_9CILI|nr:unnamed protein product [Blepharisma stoltei]